MYLKCIFRINFSILKFLFFYALHIIYSFPLFSLRSFTICSTSSIMMVDGMWTSWLDGLNAFYEVKQYKNLVGKVLAIVTGTVVMIRVRWRRRWQIRTVIASYRMAGASAVFGSLKTNILCENWKLTSQTCLSMVCLFVS